MLDIFFSTVYKTNTKKMKLVEAFLNACGLKLDKSVETFVVGRAGLDIVACGGIDKNILKCIAISKEQRGEGISLKLMSELLKVANSLQRRELFLFSKPENEDVFAQCGFNLIEKVDDKVIFMENSHKLQKYKEKLSTCKKVGEKIGCIVMNANPFTLGHQYLVSKASEICDILHVFVVSEDASRFSFEDRFALVKQGLSEFENVFVHKGSDFIISKLTFPTYFLKDSKCVDELYSRLDAQIFAHHIAPSLGINCRFVGDEPFCEVTCEYNKQLKAICEQNDINFMQIPRKKFENGIISASHVRKLYDKKDFESLEKMLPKTTLDFLKKNLNKEKSI